MNMKKPLRLIAALLAFCVTAAVFPPVGLAADSLDLRELVNAASENGVIDLGGDYVVANDVSVGGSGRNAPFVIEKPLTIQNGKVTVRAGGLVLGADVTFSDVEFAFATTEGGNFIAANGHTLKLENITCRMQDTSFNLYCGTLTGLNPSAVTVPTPGPDGRIVIDGSVSIQGSGSPGNIYAGNVYRTRDGNGQPDKTFRGNAEISVMTSKNALGAVYACGGTQDGATGTYDESYDVSGSIRVIGNAPDVYGMNSQTEVLYQGSGNEDKRTIQGVFGLTVDVGHLALESGSSARNISVSSGAKLDLKPMAGISSLNVDSFNSNGYLILKDNQTWIHNGTVSGSTTVVINSIGLSGGDSVSMGSPVEGHVYIQAPQSNEGSFVLLPSSAKPNMKLVRETNGDWKATSGSSGGDVDLVRDFSFDTSSITAEAGEEVVFPITVESNGRPWLDLIPLTVTINGINTNRESEIIENDTYYKYKDIYGYLEPMEVSGNILHVTSDAEWGHAESPYTISVTVPSTHTESKQNITRSVTLIVTKSGGTTPGPVSIAVPEAKTGLKWTGAEQTGVSEGEGYTLTGHKASNVGSYTATATLKTGFQWDTDSAEPVNIPWSIGKGDGPEAPRNLSASAPTSAGGSDGKITGTTSAMEYDTDPNFSNPRTCGAGETTGLAAGHYYIREKATANLEAGRAASITVPAYGAPVVTEISIKTPAQKTEYKTGEELDLTGLTIEVVYSDGHKEDVKVTEDMVTGFDSSAPAESRMLTITYEGQIAAYLIKIVASEQPGAPKYQVTVNNSHAAVTGAGAYEAGTTVTVHAGEYSGHVFAAWNPAGVELSNRGNPDISFVMPENDVILLATWRVSDTPGHTHAWSPDWETGETHHWHNCTASGCTITEDSGKDGYGPHTAGDWVVDRPATSSQSGTRHKACTVCGYVMEKGTIPATGSSSGGSSDESGSNSGGSIYFPSTGGGSGGSNTVKNPDGSTVTTSTNPSTGTVTETTKRPDGSKVVVETKKDGTVTSTETAADGSTVKTVDRPDGSSETTVKQSDGVTASLRVDRNGGAEGEVRLSSKAIEAAQGGAVSLPLPALPGAGDVTVHTGSSRVVRVEIPVIGYGPSVVAYLVGDGGVEKMVRTAVLTGGELALDVSDGATVRIRDNGKSFTDTRGHWAEDAIQFVASRELFSGKAAGDFAPDTPMTRGMLMTVLARLDGVEASGASAYEKGMAWAVANGISDGRNPDGRVTREQLAAMLYRYAGSPAATNRELRFLDADAVSSYAQEAARWAVENGILSGYGNGTLAPGGLATRAQASAMLMRYVTYLSQV